ncbi:MAG: transcription termination/antitermination protein NusA [Candidatus Omnitrophica bacterium]|nr:transcription termination/antitermination protein NusA [Candidatus Omnitrophota bacterium]
MASNLELIAVLEHIEREKGVSRTVLIEAIESALATAAKKILHNTEVEVTAKIDPLTGEIDVSSEGKKLKSTEFGRIAAQTAKQVIIQKIRDAERDVIYDEFEPKVNHVINGTVYRYDKGTVIIDLGKAEAILPKREQSPRDIYRQGDRIRVFVTEVSKSLKGPQIIVSRSHPGLVKRLFELEVPEVLDGIVEIKSVSREAGDRAKIAVWSKDEKVDCVGACVGMRGQRVKNIVRELQGEKIDIVRWSDNVSEFVRAALSPAECLLIQVESQEEKRVTVVVDDEQLSLAIGKNGQNVRLASKLSGWNIDIKSKAENVEAAALKLSASLGEASVADMEALSAKVKESLDAAGIKTVAALKAMTREQLLEIEGIGEKTADKIIEAAQAASQESPESAEEAARAAAERELEASVKSNLLSREPKTRERSSESVQGE